MKPQVFGSGWKWKLYLETTTQQKNVRQVILIATIAASWEEGENTQVIEVDWADL